MSQSSPGILDFPYPSVKIGAVVAFVHYKILLGLLSLSMVFLVSFALSVALFLPYFRWEKKYSDLKTQKPSYWYYSLTVNSLATTCAPFIAGEFRAVG